VKAIDKNDRKSQETGFLTVQCLKLKNPVSEEQSKLEMKAIDKNGWIG
jgi:hypothetical protein